MHPKRSDERPSERSMPHDEDEATQAAVLSHLLTLHPTQLTAEELTRELSAAEEFHERDRIARAVRDLTATGLLHRNGPFATPTRPALRFHELMEW